QIVDVSNPRTPHHVVDLPSQSGFTYGIEVIGKLAYVADGGAGLQVVDVSVPDSPRKLGSIYTLGEAKDVRVVGSLAFVANAYDTVCVVDVSNPANLQLVGQIHTGGDAERIQIAGDLLYVADGRGGLSILRWQEVRSQAIEFELPPTLTAADSPYTLKASASSGLPVTFAVVSGPATIQGNQLTLTGPGQITVRATQPGNAQYQPASAEQTTQVVDGPAPVGLTASVGAFDEITLSWEDSFLSENGFKIERSTDGTNFLQIAQVLPNTVTFRDRGRWPGKTYYYRVCAYGKYGNSAYSSVAGGSLPPLGPTSIISWGLNDSGQANVPAGLTNAIAIAAWGRHGLALRSDGTVVGWGENGGGVRIPYGLTGVVSIATGRNHSMALTEDGGLLCWGDNSGGETTPPAGLSNVVAISAGNLYSLALKNDGTVVGWGNCAPPGQWSQPAGLTGVVAIAAGGDHCLALKSDGTVVGWGQDAWGQATPPTDLSNVVAISAGDAHSLALRNDGSVVVWGYLGENVPLTPIANAVAGSYHNLAVTKDGNVIGWGFSVGGNLDIPSELKNPLAIAAGDFFGLALVPLWSTVVAPTALAAQSISPSQIVLSWKDESGGEDGFCIERALETNGIPVAWTQVAIAPSNVTNFTDVGLPAGTKFWYRVRAFNSKIWSEYSELASAVTPGPGGGDVPEIMVTDPEPLSPGPVWYVGVQAGTTLDRTFYVTNVGSGTLVGNAIVPAPFQVVSGASYSLGANEGHEVIV
ncbi:MAG TPA: hypothetical protein VEC99_15880, partial [Clostridia bacterium]|nr:hypothetical protein [Clostridia bacterium]